MKLYKIFKNTMALTAVSTTLLASMPVATFAADYNGHWAEKAINEWKDKGVIDGYEDGSFKPKEEVTRAEFAKMLVKVFGLTNKDGAKKYNDIASEKWYANDVALVSVAGLMFETEDNNFRPNDKITREEACYALATVYHVTGNTNKVFEDQESISDWAADSVEALVASGYVNGYLEDGTFRPQGKLTRAEAVTMLDKITAEILNVAGTYTQDTQGNLVVNTKDVILKDMIINGNLYLAEGIGEGDVTLDNVRVTGRTIVEGGGANSAKLINTQLGKVEVSKSKGLVRIAADSKSSIDTMKVESSVQLEGNMGTVEVATKEAVKLVNAVIKEMQVTTAGAKVDLDAKTVVTMLVADEKVEVSGKGQIKEAEINASGVEFKDSKPDKVETAPGVEKPNTPSTPSGGGDGSSSGDDSSTPSVSTYSVSGRVMLNGKTVPNAEVRALPYTTTVEGNNYEDENAVWIRADEKGQFVFPKLPKGKNYDLHAWYGDDVRDFKSSCLEVVNLKQNLINKEITLEPYTTIQTRVLIWGSEPVRESIKVRVEKEGEKPWETEINNGGLLSSDTWKENDTVKITVIDDNYKETSQLIAIKEDLRNNTIIRVEDKVQHKMQVKEVKVLNESTIQVIMPNIGQINPVIADNAFNGRYFVSWKEIEDGDAVYTINLPEGKKLPANEEYKLLLRKRNYEIYETSIKWEPTAEEVKVESVNVADIKVTTGSAIQLKADVKVTPNTEENKKVTWKFKEGTDVPKGLELSTDGRLTTNTTTGSAIVIATSVKDPNKFDEARIEIVAKGKPEVSKVEVKSISVNAIGSAVTVKWATL